MAVKRDVFIKAGLITLALFASVYSLNLYLNSEREHVLDEKMNDVIDEFEEFQALEELMDVYGENATCLTLNSQLKLMDTKIWKLGEKIENYRRLSKEYMSDPYYQLLKEKFNRQQVIYLANLKQMKARCGMDQLEIVFFYKKSENCPTCDEQSYVLNYFNQFIDPEIAVFSLDSDMNSSSVNVLEGLYNVTEYPCVVVGESVNCGLQDRAKMEEYLCRESEGSLSICKNQD